MKKVAVFNNKLLPRSQTFIKEQVKSLQQWDATLVGYHVDTEGLSLDGVNYRLVFGTSVRRLQSGVLHLCQLLGIPHSPTVRALDAIDAQVVHVHFGTNAVFLWPSVRKLGLPMVVTLHGFDINRHREWWESGRGGWWRKRYPQQLLALADQPEVFFVAISETVRARAIEFGIPSGKVVTRYIGVDTSKFSDGIVPINQRAKRVLFVGRLVEVKGVEYLIRAFALIRSRISDAELVIAGDGPLKKHLEDLADSQNVPVTFLGAISNEEVRCQMQQTRVFCLPSVTTDDGQTEGLGIVLLEAQACGTPVVTSGLGGRNEAIIHRSTGFRFAERDVEVLSEQLCEVLLNSDLSAELSTNATAFVSQQFDIKMCSRALEQTYNSIVHESSKQHI